MRCKYFLLPVFLLTVALNLRADPLRDFTGFTRPGSPDDTVQENKITAVADDAQQRKEAVGGTIYYMVLERKDGKNPWGTGIADLVQRFQPGVDFGGRSSPNLDPSAKYLYLYQVVNDRGTEVPIQSISLNLLVDLKKKEMTSWGLFNGLGFAIASKKAPEKKNEILPISTGHSPASSLAERAFKIKSPAFRAADPYSLRVIPSREGVGPEKPKEGKVRVDWNVLDPARGPSVVMLLAATEEKPPIFRAIWNEKTILKKGQRSAVFGFTSNLPPELQPVSLRGQADEKRGGVIPAAGEGQAEPDEGVVTAEGEAPSPKPTEVAKKEEVPPPLPPRFQPPPSIPGGPIVTPAQPQGIPQAGGGSGSPGGQGTSSGSPALLGTGGGGSGGGTGGGSGSGALTAPINQRQQENQQQNQTQTNGSNSTSINLQITQAVQQNVEIDIDNNNVNENNNSNVNNNNNANNNENVNNNTNVNNNQNININKNLSMSKSTNKSSDSGKNGDSMSGEVVPEPKAILLAALGLPFLLLLLWHQRSRHTV